MSPHEGRVEKQVRLAMPVKISKLWDPAGVEPTVTENLGSIGMRIVIRKAVEPGERLLARFVA